MELDNTLLLCRHYTTLDLFYCWAPTRFTSHYLASAALANNSTTSSYLQVLYHVHSICAVHTSDFLGSILSISLQAIVFSLKRHLRIMKTPIPHGWKHEIVYCTQWPFFKGLSTRYGGFFTCAHTIFFISFKVPSMSIFLFFKPSSVMHELYSYSRGFSSFFRTIVYFHFFFCCPLVCHSLSFILFSLWACKCTLQFWVSHTRSTFLLYTSHNLDLNTWIIPPLLNRYSPQFTPSQLFPSSPMISPLVIQWIWNHTTRLLFPALRTSPTLVCSYILRNLTVVNE